MGYTQQLYDSSVFSRHLPGHTWSYIADRPKLSFKNLFPHEEHSALLWSICGSFGNMNWVIDRLQGKRFKAFKL